jgi:hypothetical protein
MPNVSNVKSKYFGVSTATDRNGICAAQTTSGAASLTLDGAGVSSGTASWGTNAGATVSVYAASANTGVTFTFTGTDLFGAAQTATLTGPGAGATVNTTEYFVTITAAEVDAAITGNAEVGWTRPATDVGGVFKGRTRIRGLQGLSGTTAGDVSFNNTSITGTTLLTVPTQAAAELIEPYIPDNGVLFDAGAYISYANAVLAGITVFYDG